MIITTSADISLFDFSVLWDLSGIIPTVKITNTSGGDHLENITYWFEMISGGGTTFHKGTELTPDKVGVWVEFIPTEPIPVVLGHIEWSGNPFEVIGYAKDTEGHIYVINDKAVRICRPTGNTGAQADNFGAGSLEAVAKCEMARLYIEDQTNYTYQGLVGLNISKFFKLIYPPDATGTIPAPRQVNNVNSALIPISQSGDGYQVMLVALYQYFILPTVSVKIRYRYSKTFKISCHVDLCPLICDIERLEKKYNEYGCNAQEREIMALINSKLTRAIMAKMQPLCGVDVAAIVAEIKALGGFTCECEGNEFNGINPFPENGSITCADVMDCLNTQLNTLDPKCMATQLEWEAMSFLAKFQKIIDNYCCVTITDIT